MSIITITGIGTEVGKTTTSAIMVQALAADYWKPVQCGLEPSTDRHTVRQLVTHESIECHPEAYLLEHPVSPHQAARMSGQELDPNKVSLPNTNRPLIIETAGGVMVPFRQSVLMLDLLTQWESHWVIVSKHYVGSINHTLMTVEVLRQRGVPIWGIVFNGSENPDSERFILEYTGLPCLARIQPEPEISQNTIQRYAAVWKTKLQSKMLTI